MVRSCYSRSAVLFHCDHRVSVIFRYLIEKSLNEVRSWKYREVPDEVRGLIF